MNFESTWWRPFVTTAVFAFLPVAVFLGDNKGEAELTGVLVVITLGLTALGIAIVEVARRRARGLAERAGVLWATAVFVTFQYAAVTSVVTSLGADPTKPRYAGAVWFAVFVAAMLLAFVASRSPVVWPWVLTVGCVLVTISMVQYARFYFGGGNSVVQGVPHPATNSHADAGGPDVYYFLLDGYGRGDRLGEATGYDNKSFLRALRERGFDVNDRAQTSYPITKLAQLSTMAMDYAVTEGTDPFNGEATIKGIMTGQNTVVASMDRLGYEYQLATDYDLQGFECSQTVVCAVSAPGLRGVIGTTERAFLDSTPLSPIVPSVLDALGAESAVVAPDKAVREIEGRQGDDPVFAYVHILAPHPPYRYTDGCSSPIPFAGGGDQSKWGPAAGAGGRNYIQTIRCLNRQLIRAIDQLLKEDPNTIVVLQGDHGPAFGFSPDEKPILNWSDREVRERYSVLSAAHFPVRCRNGSEATRLTVNTFAPVLSCLTGESVPLRRPRFFGLSAGRVSPLASVRVHGAR